MPTELTLETPNERAPQATVELRTTAPPGVEIVSARAPAGWKATVDGSTVRWSGGRIERSGVTPFPVSVNARVRAGTYAFTSIQRYSDGATVRWKADFTVLPATGAAAPSQHPWSALVAVLVGIVLIAASLVGVRLLRRRALRDR